MKNPQFNPRPWIRYGYCKREIQKTKKGIKYCGDCVKLGYKNI